MSNKTFLCIQRSQQALGDKTPPSPAQMEEMYARFNEWKNRFHEQIIDMGGKLGEGAVVTSEQVTDGPFIEAKEVVGGYMIVSCATLAEASDIAQQSPGVWAPGSSVEVREIHTS